VIIQRGPVLSGGLSTLCLSFHMASGDPSGAPKRVYREKKKLLEAHNAK